MGENDYQTGYRGGQFHHGMDRVEYERGKSQKETEDALANMAGGGRKVEVPGVAFTLLLIAPLIWMVYPVLGVTILAVPGILVAICLAMKMQGVGPYLIAFIIGVASFFPGMALETKISQFTVYRWIRGVLRILFAFVGITALMAGKHAKSFNDIPPGALVGGFFGAVMAYLILQRLDLIYFPAQAEIKKMVEQVARGERPQRTFAKRLWWGFCWFIPAMMVLNLVVNIGVRMVMEEGMARKSFYDQYSAVIFCVNAAVWYALCFLGKLPGTSKYRFSKEHEGQLSLLQK